MTTMTLWITIGLAALITAGYKAIGPVTLGNRDLPKPAKAVIALLPPALLAGLIVTDIAGNGWSALDWRLCAGLVTIVVAHLLRAPSLLAIFLGVVTTAALRMLL